MRRIHWQLPAAVVLLVLLAALAALQSRWLGELGDAERERMRASLRSRAAAFSLEFDTELTRLFLAFQMERDLLDRDPAAALGGAYRSWQATTAAPSIVRGIYVVSGMAIESARLQRFDPIRGGLERVEWPPEFQELSQRTPRLLPQLAALPRPLMMVDAVEAAIPALIIPAPHLTATKIGDDFTLHPTPGAEGRVLIVSLDPDSLRRQLIEPLAAKHFGDAATSEYLVTIVRRDDRSSVFTSGDPVEAGAADVTAGVFDLRMNELTRMPGGRGGHASAPGQPADRVAITIVRRANAPDGRRVLMGGDEQGAWEVRLRHREGSLESIVARSRRRNLAISLGVLGVLAASIVLFLASAERQHRIARQQMEFVAAVSHELRTPLAVICSAGENLADGVVADAPQVKRYGALIETEGRRLGDMVERVMEFAGISAGTAMRARAPVDPARVVDDAVEAVRRHADDRGVTITVHRNGSLPAVLGDLDALRSAVQNVIGNAVKYSPAGAAVDVTTHVQNGASSGCVQIRVADRGLGIDADDLPHIFKPFYRGRRAVDAQVRGTGVGLSVVRHVVDAHGGSVAVESRAGEGTTVVVELPGAPAESRTS